MATELDSGALRVALAKVTGAGLNRSRELLDLAAFAIETQAKMNASTGSHRYGTPTPASPGAGPSVISGTLRRSITKTPTVSIGVGWQVRIGVAGGFYPNYPKKGRSGRGKSSRSRGSGNRASSSEYGGYLERGELRNGAKYPFLLPAFEFVHITVMPTLLRQVFAPGWWLG